MWKRARCERVCAKLFRGHAPALSLQHTGRRQRRTGQAAGAGLGSGFPWVKSRSFGPRYRWLHAPYITEQGRGGEGGPKARRSAEQPL